MNTKKPVVAKSKWSKKRHSNNRCSKISAPKNSKEMLTCKYKWVIDRLIVGKPIDSKSYKKRYANIDLFYFSLGLWMLKECIWNKSRTAKETSTLPTFVQWPRQLLLQTCSNSARNNHVKTTSACTSNSEIKLILTRLTRQLLTHLKLWTWEHLPTLECEKWMNE